VLEVRRHLSIDALTVAQVWELSYPELMAVLAVENTPPGGADTVDDWIDQAAIGSGSHVLDLACCTGFSSRRIARRVGARSVGVDLSAAAINEAEARRDAEGLTALASYVVADASTLPFADGSFSHVVAGCTFGFIVEPDAALDEVNRVLCGDGALCIATFGYASPPPQEMLDMVEREIGYRPRPDRTLDAWDAFFSRRFRRSFERPLDLPFLPQHEIRLWSARTALSSASGVEPHRVQMRAALRKRLAANRLTLNEHRRYQVAAVSVWRPR
jgi:SAM-dependent methyltransferase